MVALVLETQQRLEEMWEESELTTNYYFKDIFILFLLGSFHYYKQ